jgi:tetratricopeptide (TPR) repeat protein
MTTLRSRDVVLVFALAGCGGAPAPTAAVAPANARYAEGTAGRTDVPAQQVEARAAVDSAALEQLSAGRDAASSGDYGQARAALEGASQKDPTFPEPHYNLGVLEEWQGRPAEARRHYEAALAVKADFGPAVLAIAMQSFRQGDRAGAVSYAEGQLAKNPDSNGLKNAVNRVRLLAGQTEAAIRDSMLVLRADEKNVDAMKILAAGYARQGKHELALSVLRNARELDAKDPEIHAKMARSHLAMDEKPEARVALEAAVKVPGGGSAEAYNDLGLIYHEAGDYAGAEEMFRKALSRWPDMVQAHMNLGSALKGQQKYAEAEGAMKRALELDPTAADVQFNLGILYLDGQLPTLEALARLEQSVSWFERYKQNPNRAGAPDPDPVEQYLTEARKRIEVERKRAESARKTAKDPAPEPASAAPAPAAPEGGQP